jgi:hypothetical protein
MAIGSAKFIDRIQNGMRNFLLAHFPDVSQGIIIHQSCRRVSGRELREGVKVIFTAGRLRQSGI